MLRRNGNRHRDHPSQASDRQAQTLAFQHLSGKKLGALEESADKSYKINGRHVETRTLDLYGVNVEVTTVKPVSWLAFPVCYPGGKRRKQPGW